eukprot:3651284-Pyramimonas_sp.AAC.1
MPGRWRRRGCGRGLGACRRASKPCRTRARRTTSTRSCKLSGKTRPRAAFCCAPTSTSTYSVG